MEAITPNAEDIIGALKTLIRAIGFAKNPAGRWEMDLTDFFREPCKHG